MNANNSKQPELTVGLQRRKELKALSKGALLALVVPLGTFSPPAHAVWVEIARAIANAIAQFIDQMYKNLTTWWENAQKTANQKVQIAKARAKDSQIDFRVQLENLRRVNAIKPTTNLCDQESVAIKYNAQVENDINRQATAVSTSALVIGNEQAGSINRGMRYFSKSGSTLTFKPAAIIRSIGDANAKVMKGEQLSADEALALSKTTMADTASLAMDPIRQIAAQTTDASELPPQITASLQKSMFNSGAMTFATKLYTDALPTTGNHTVHVPSAAKLAMDTIQSRYTNTDYQSEIQAELNEVALASEYVRLIGERVYVLNQQYKQNEKIIAALAIQVLQQSKA